MKSLFAENKSDAALSPIDEHPDYRTRQEVVDRLKKDLNVLSLEKTALINKANQYRRTPVHILAEAYLREPRPVLGEDGILLNKKIGELNLRINALHIAIETAEREVNAIRYKLSAATAEDQADTYRTAARRVLAGMLIIQCANTEISQLRLTREVMGYCGLFTPVVMNPWPYWGDPQEESSVWRMILKEFLERGHISAAEHYRIINGSLTSFEP